MKLVWEDKGIGGSGYTFNFLKVRDRLDNF